MSWPHHVSPRLQGKPADFRSTVQGYAESQFNLLDQYAAELLGPNPTSSVETKIKVLGFGMCSSCGLDPERFEGGPLYFARERRFTAAGGRKYFWINRLQQWELKYEYPDAVPMTVS